MTRSTSVTHSAPVVAAAPIAAAPLPATDTAPPPVADSVETTTVTTTTPLATEATPTPTRDITGTMGVILLALLALAILAAGALFLRRRHPAAVMTTTETEPYIGDTAVAPVAETPLAEPAVATAAAATPLSAASAYRRRDANPVRGALPSDGASVDLPAQLPEDYEERAALLERMVNAAPDKANPFTDRRARTRRARLIMQSIGQRFDHEPRIDLSQYPNNWPELQRQYHKAA